MGMVRKRTFGVFTIGLLGLWAAVAQAAPNNYEVTIDEVGVDNTSSSTAYIKASTVPGDKAVPKVANYGAGGTQFTAQSFSVPDNAKREMLALALAAKTNRMTVRIRFEETRRDLNKPDKAVPLMNLFLLRQAPTQ